MCGCTSGLVTKRTEVLSSAPHAAPSSMQESASAKVQLGVPQRFVSAEDISAEWWKLFQSPQLDTLIKRSFKTNPDFEAAQAALQRAKEYAAAQQGFFYPKVSASYPPSRNKMARSFGSGSTGQENNGPVIQADSNGGVKREGPAYYSFQAVQLTVGYMPDMFEANHGQVESAQARTDGTYITLASHVVAAAIQEASLRAQIEAQLRIVSLDQQALEIVRNQLKLGYVKELDVRQQEMTSALAQRELAPLQEELEQTRDLMHALAGNTSAQDMDHDLDQDIDEAIILDGLHLEQELPLSLPSRLVEQRPDVRMAEMQLHEVSARYGVNITRMMPQFTVSGAIGGMASSPKWMVKNGGSFFDLAAKGSNHIFDNAALRTKTRVARQDLILAGAQYRSVVMAALQNVADILYVIQSDDRALKAASKAAQVASKMGEQTRNQYEAGSVDFQGLLVAQQNEQLAIINLVQAQTNRFGDAVALFQALGGGWWGYDKPAKVKNRITLKK
nr:efflux transporter outer membrane subunit [Sideroxydans lithotrophicus]